MSGSFYKQTSLNNSYRSPVRQRGTGICSLALKVARHALAFLSKYVLPSSKRLETILLQFCCPKYLMLSLVVNEQPLQPLKKRASGKTVKKQLDTGAAKKKRRQSIGKSSKTKNNCTSKKGRKKKQQQQQQKRVKNVIRLTFFKTCLDCQTNSQNNYDDGSSCAQNT